MVFFCEMFNGTATLGQNGMSNMTRAHEHPTSPVQSQQRQHPAPAHSSVSSITPATKDTKTSANAVNLSTSPPHSRHHSSSLNAVTNTSNLNGNSPTSAISKQPFSASSSTAAGSSSLLTSQAPAAHQNTQRFTANNAKPAQALSFSTQSIKSYVSPKSLCSEYLFYNFFFPVNFHGRPTGERNLQIALIQILCNI